MSKTQLKVLWVGIGIFVLMGLFPPRKSVMYITPIGAGFEEWKKPARYGFILTMSTQNIALNNLFIQWAIVAVVTGGLIYTLKDKKKDRI